MKGREDIYVTGVEKYTLEQRWANCGPHAAREGILCGPQAVTRT